jgi:CBS domain-containing protein
MQGFDPSNPPFDRLTQQEVDQVTAALDIGYFRPGEAIVRQASASERLHVIIKGAVEGPRRREPAGCARPEGQLRLASRRPRRRRRGLRRAQETLCYLIPRDLILRLIRDNPAFAAFFYADVSRKLDAHAGARKAEGMESVLRSRIRDVRLGAPSSSTGCGR